MALDEFRNKITVGSTDLIDVISQTVEETPNTSVSYEAQSLSAEQKSQARSNIGVVTLTNDGVTALGSNIDYNTVINPGFYHVNGSGATNAPAGSSASKLIVMGMGQDNTYITQIAFPLSAGTIPKYRMTSNAGSSWSSWQPYLSDYVSVSAQTLTTEQKTQAQENIGGPFLRSEGGTLIRNEGSSTPNLYIMFPFGSSSIGNYSFFANGFTKGTTPSGVTSARYYLYDGANSATNSSALSGIQLGIDEEGKTYSRLVAFPNKSGALTFSSIALFVDAEGNATTYAPTPTAEGSVNQIATTGFVSDTFVSKSSITYGTDDLTAGSSPLATGTFYFVYE